MNPVLPTDQAARNAIPMADGLLDYFPNALAAVAALSRVANEQHNPGEPMHWARNKSTDHANKILKHLVDRGIVDTDGQRHSTKVAWRALALLEDELIAAGAVPGRNAKGTPKFPPYSDGNLPQVGDRVRVVRIRAPASYPHQVAYIGKIGVVDENDNVPLVTFDDGERQVFFAEYELERVA